MSVHISIRRQLQVTEEWLCCSLTPLSHTSTACFIGRGFRNGHPAYHTGVLAAAAVGSSLLAWPVTPLCGKLKVEAKDWFPPAARQVRMGNLATQISHVFVLLVKLKSCCNYIN